MLMNEPDFEDPAIDMDALLGDIDRLRETLVSAAPELANNHHNYVRVSAIEQLMTKVMVYVKSMK
jgi:hypothetical protein